MKILKIFGIVVGIHLFALILIFANPGCSSTTKPQSMSASGSGETDSPILAAPIGTSGESLAANGSRSSSAIMFHPDTPAAAAPVIDTGVRFSPTRPGTPAAGAMLSEPVTGVMPATLYTVKSGDNLWTIARRNNLTVAQLTDANGISASAILRPGQKLLIPRKPGSSAAAQENTRPPATLINPEPAAVASRPGATVFKHVVKSGETLGGIARRYDVRQGDLAVANNIADPKRIRPGQELIVPGWKSAGSKAAQAASEAAAAPVQPPEQSRLPSTLDLLRADPADAAPPPVPVIQIEDELVPAPL